MTSRSKIGLQHTFVALAVILVAGLAADVVLWPRDSLPGVTPVAQYDYFSRSFVDRADAFRGLQSWLGVISLLLLVFIPLAVALFWPRGTRRDEADDRADVEPNHFWDRWTDRRSGAIGGRGSAFSSALLAVLIASFTLLATLPLEVVGFRRSRHYGLTVQGFGGWLWDWILTSALTVAGIALLALVAAALVKKFRRSWWALFGVSLVALAIVVQALSPVLIAPLFAKFEPLPAGQTRSDVQTLAREAGVKTGQIYSVDAANRTTGANAYVTGLGASKRVVIYDTLLKDFTAAERKQVVAHELGHAKHNDLVAGLLWFAFVAMTSMFAVDLLGRVMAERKGVDLASPAGMAMLVAAAMIAVAISQPAANAYSRKIEARADAFGMQTTQDPNAAIALERRLTVNNVSRPDPPAALSFLFGTHPTPIDRIGMAVTVKREQKGLPAE